MIEFYRAYVTHRHSTVGWAELAMPNVHREKVGRKPRRAGSPTAIPALRGLRPTRPDLIPTLQHLSKEIPNTRMALTHVAAEGCLRTTRCNLRAGYRRHARGRATQPRQLSCRSVHVGLVRGGIAESLVCSRQYACGTLCVYAPCKQGSRICCAWAVHAQPRCRGNVLTFTAKKAAGPVSGYVLGASPLLAELPCRFANPPGRY